MECTSHGVEDVQKYVEKYLLLYHTILLGSGIKKELWLSDINA